MITLNEGKLSFTFAEGWLASQYDEWEFYRQIMDKGFGAKGVDFVAISPEKVLHLIEVKDFRHPEHKTVPISDLPEEITKKCLDTMTGLFAARILANDPDELEFAREAARTKKLQVTFHFMIKRESGRLSNPGQVQNNLHTKLQSKIRKIDPHARVVAKGYPWKVHDHSFHPHG